MSARVAIKQVRNLFAVNLRFPGQGNSSQGKSDPKSRPRGVGDGKQVNIPVPPTQRLSEGGTEKGRPSYDRKCRFKLVEGRSRQIRSAITSRSDEERLCLANWLIPCFQEKPRSKLGW